tara:strand:+ start:6426 stop:7532 length:1107 start_codon:yes stop_codon:yes gene_type:complete
MYFKKYLKIGFIFSYILLICFFSSLNVNSQNHQLIEVLAVVSGNETNNTLFKVKSENPKLQYVRAQRIDGPQNGIFTQNNDNIRYTALSSVSGIPGNLSKIRFSFLEKDKRTLIDPTNFRFIINDIDGPNNEALATNCDANLSFLGTANPTNLVVINLPPTIIAIGKMEENDGATSRVMFEFNNVSVIEMENYANDGYLKDFDMNDDYPISKPIYVKCNSYTSSIYTKRDTANVVKSDEFKKENDLLKVNTNPIYFDTDKFEIRNDAAVELEKVLVLMNKYPKLIIELASHTDSRDDDQYNIKLSENRAKATVKWLINKGIDSLRISGKGFGETQLLNECVNGIKCTEDQHQINRRTEFIIINPEVIK